MDCPSCGAHNILGAEHCVNCGTDLSNIIPASRAPDFVHEPIRNVPRRPVATVGPTDPVGLAVSHFQRQKVDCVLVIDGSEVAGIITSADILQKVAGPKEDLNAVTCAEIMTSDPVCLGEDDNLALAINMMASGEFRHVPILENGAPVNILNVADVFRHLSPYLT